MLHIPMRAVVFSHTVCFHDWEHELKLTFSFMKHSVCNRFYPSNYMQRDLWSLPQISWYYKSHDYSGLLSCLVFLPGMWFSYLKSTDHHFRSYKVLTYIVGLEVKIGNIDVCIIVFSWIIDGTCPWDLISHLWELR